MGTTSKNHFPDRAALAELQLEKLNALLGALVPSNLFYSRKFREQAAAPHAESLEAFSRTFPFTTKDELSADQLRRPPYGSNLTFSLERYTKLHHTSGMQGTPLRWLDTPESWDWMLRNWEQVFRAADVHQKDRVFCAFSFGPFIGFWLAFEAAARMGCLTMPGGGLSSELRLLLIMDHGISVLCATPTYAIRLGELARATKLDLSKSAVRVILVAGEPGGSLPATRARIESLWPGARVFDHHGMTEVGPVTHECPERPGVLHVIESSYLPEVIDPQTDMPVAPEGTGELVLTTLGRTGSPVIRYRTRDLVRRGPDAVCACGRSDLTLEGGILGRTDDMIVVRGVNVYPSAVDEIIRTCGGISEYRVRVQAGDSMTELLVEVEPEDPEADPYALVDRLGKAFQASMSLRIPVTCVAPGDLPRFEMKARRWERE